MQLLRERGVNEVRVLRFTPELASKPPQQFVDEHLLRFYPLQALVVGYDFALGRDREGGVPTLRRIGKRCGFAVEVVDAVSVDGEAISSTRIRSALDRGETGEAERLLGRPYELAGDVVEGEGRGRQLGFPTANLAVDPRKQKPAPGVYAVWVSGVKPELCPGAVNLGRRPTFGEAAETVEVHIPGWEGDLRGRRLGLRFGSRIRSEVKFNNANELKRQIERDVLAARRLLGSGPDADNTLERPQGR
jgi:riboflavin kinase/FMN adenylyltransferase